MESQAMRFWREVVRRDPAQRRREGCPYRVRFGTETHEALFPDGSSVEWCRKTGEMISFVGTVRDAMAATSS